MNLYIDYSEFELTCWGTCGRIRVLHEICGK